MGEILKGKDKGIHIRQLLNKKKKSSLHRVGGFQSQSGN